MNKLMVTAKIMDMPDTQLILSPTAIIGHKMLVKSKS
jgi:hypothetical protein